MKGLSDFNDVIVMIGRFTCFLQSFRITVNENYCFNLGVIIL